METLKDLAIAVSKMQAEIEGAKKTSNNPFFKSAYADLHSVWEAVRTPLTKNNLSVIQMPYSDGNLIGIETTLLHSSGQSMTQKFGMVPIKNDPQAVGSLITYFRRYSLMAVCGVAPEDDDGNSASQPVVNRLANNPASKPTSNKNIMPFGKQKGKHFDDMKASDLESTAAWCDDKPQFAELVKSIRTYLSQQ